MNYQNQRKIFFFAVGLLLSTLSFGQQLTTTEVTSLFELKVCQSKLQEFNLVKNSGNYAISDEIVVTLSLPTTVELASASLLGSGNLVVDNTIPSAPLLTVTNVTGNTIALSYSIKAACSAFNASTSPALTNGYSVKLNANFDHAGQSSSYNIVSPWLVFDAAGSTNLNYNLGQFNVPIERTFKYINTSSTNFIGDFLFTDTVQVGGALAGVSFSDIEIIYPLGVELYRIVTDSTVEIKASITGLGVGDSIVIKEKVNLISCPSGIDNSVTWFKANYGCQGGNLCQTLSNASSYTTSAFDPNDKPNLQYRYLDISYSCPAVDDQRTFKFTNTGAGNAQSLDIQMVKALGNNISYFDTTTIEMYKYVSGVPVNVPYQSYYVLMNANSPSSNHPYQYRIKSLEPIASGDSIFLSYPEQHVCIDTADYDNYFNGPTAMNNITVLARFDHPCFPTISRNTDDSKSVWGPFSQEIALSQNFENLTGSMEMNEEKWFEIANQTPLILNSPHPYFPYEMAIEIDKAQFQVELTLEPGLGLVADSLLLCSFQSTQDSVWIPNSITYITGNSAFPGQGDKIIATFDIPAYFQQLSPGNPHYKYGAKWKKSDSYERFFNSFRVKFKLHAYCEYVSGNSIAVIEEKTYLVYDKTCSPDCKIPLSFVADLVNIHCPGCILPGWNLTAFDLERRNIGQQDNDNNNYPDSYPSLSADPNLVNSKRVMLGDTIDCHLVGHTSNGEGPGVLFSDIGFDYTQGQFVIQGGLLSNLSFTGATGSYKRLDGLTATFTIPASAGTFTAGSFFIDVSIAALESYGLPAAFISRFWIGETMTIDPQFRVVNNLINGTGADPYFSTESLSAWYYMSGTPFTGLNIKPDANEVDVNDLIAATAAERAELLYWCTGYDGRITGIGTDFTYGNATIENYNGIWGVTSPLDPCYSKIKTVIATDVGDAHSGAYYGYDSNNQSALNSFDFELRNLWMLDTISWVIPDDWEVHRVEFRVSQLKKNQATNLTSYTCGTYDWFSPFVIPAAGVFVQDSTVTVHPAQYYAQLLEAPISCPNDLTAYDETKRYSINLVVRMKDCNTRNTVNMSGGYPIITHWSNFPGALTGDTIIVRNMASGRILDKPSATLDVQVLASSQNTAAGNDLSWNVNIQAQAGSIYDVTNRSATNTFFYFDSPSGNINVTDMNWISPGTPILAPDSINGIPLWRVGKVGDTYSFGGRTGAIKVNAAYDCSQVQVLDSVYLIYGWNCYNYPTAINEACYFDTLTIYIQPENPGLQTLLAVDDIVNACDTLDYNLELKATGIGDVEDIEIRLNLPVGGELTYLPGSGMLSFDGNSTALEPSLDSLGLYWNLDSVNFMTGNFHGLSPEANLVFSVKSSCGFNDEEVELEISATNYCGKLIGPFNIERSPNVILGLPTLDSLSFSMSAANMTPCGDSSLITLTVTNVGTKATGAFNALDFVLPANFEYLSGDLYSAISGSTLTYNLDPGVLIGGTQLISFYVTNLSFVTCGSYPIAGTVYVGEEYYCDSLLCFLDGGQSNAVTYNDSIVVEDTTTPVINGVPPSATVSCENVPSAPSVSVTDNCDYVLTFMEDTTAGNCPSNYILTRTWTAVDDCGNSSNASQVLTVVDNEAPEIDCPLDINLASGDSIASWNVLASDNCGIVQLSSSVASGSVFPVGTTIVQITALDACGNTSICNFEVTRTPPLIVDAGGCQSIHLGYAPMECIDLTASILIGSTGPYTYLWSNGATAATTNVCPQVTTTYTVTVTDANNFTATSSVVVHVIDARCGNNGKKVMVCHVPPGNPSNVQQICIGIPAVGAHVDPTYGHSGCHIGYCDEIDPCSGLPRSFIETSEEAHATEPLMSIYPNPNNGEFTIQLTDDVELENTTIGIYNVLGQRIQHIEPSEFSTVVDLNLNSVEGAVYFVRIISGDYSDTQKVIIE